MTRRALALSLVVAATVAADAGPPVPPNPPVVVDFSPAAVHAGDAIAVDVRSAGTGRPRVWIGRRRASTASVRVEPLGDDGTMRVFARVPKRVEAGDHEVRVATRGGKSAAAKRVQVASCHPAPAGGSGECGGNIPDSGVNLTITGDGGYRKVVAQSASVTPTAVSGQTVVEISAAGIGTFFVNIPLEPDRIHVGRTPMYAVDFSDAHFNYYDLENDFVEVVEESPTRVGICFDMTLPTISASTPSEVRVKGYLVFKR
jgi:hypothetical protein